VQDDEKLFLMRKSKLRWQQVRREWLFERQVKVKCRVDWQ
jgi:hypothetical protein